VRPLVPEARQRLTAAFSPPAHFILKETFPMMDLNRLPLEGEGGLIEMLRTVVDPRKPWTPRSAPGCSSIVRGEPGCQRGR
jgi:hypothetical protein